MGKVFVIHEPPAHSGMDLTPASTFGEIRILVPARWNSLATSQCVAMLREKLRGFSDDDYLLPVGDPVLMIIAGAIAAQFNHGRVNILKWDKRSKAYVSIEANTYSIGQNYGTGTDF